jgi:hypothetical protein
MNLIKRGEIIFDTDFLSNWQSELVEMNRKKERSKIPLSKLLDMATSQSKCLSTSIQTAGRISRCGVLAHINTERESTRLYNNVVEL